MARKGKTRICTCPVGAAQGQGEITNEKCGCGACSLPSHFFTEYIIWMDEVCE
jgi:hypothetical protein